MFPFLGAELCWQNSLIQWVTSVRPEFFTGTGQPLVTKWTWRHLAMKRIPRWGFIKKPVLSITSSVEIGFWEHDIEASKMQGRARGRKGERKTYHITIYHHITMEFGGYSLNVAKKNPRAQERARAKRKGSYPTKKQQEFLTTPRCPTSMAVCFPTSWFWGIHTRPCQAGAKSS